MSTKTFIVSGDSFTAPNIHETAAVPWPTYFAEQAGWNLINVAKGGASNQYIFNAMIDTLEEHKGEDIHAFCLWTEPYRINFFDNSCVILNSLKNLLQQAERSSEELSERRKEYIQNSYATSHMIMKEMKLKYKDNFFQIYDKIVNQTLRYMWMFEEYCSHNNITYSHASSINPFGDNSIIYSILEPDENLEVGDVEFDNGVKRVRKNSPYYKHLLTSQKYMGFQFAAWHWIKQQRLYVSEFDSHPNDLGHRELGKIFYDYIFHDKKLTVDVNNYLRPVYIYD